MIHGLRRGLEHSAAAILALLLSGCAEGGGRYFSVAREPGADSVVIHLVPAPHVRINARLAPVLELPDGRVLRFSGTALTADSSYFTAPPVLAVRGSPRGMIRASVCPEGDSVCRVVEMVSGER